jgi:hypothetical protein
MKAQFMVISVIFIGLSLITAGAVIDETNSREFSDRGFTYQVISIQTEAEKLDAEELQIENLKKMIYMSAYSGEIETSGSNCDNIILKRPDEEYKINCQSP